MRKPKPDHKQVTQTITAMQAQGLAVKGIIDRNGSPLILWINPPTEAERAQANLILPGALHDA